MALETVRSLEQVLLTQEEALEVWHFDKKKRVEKCEKLEVRLWDLEGHTHFWKMLWGEFSKFTLTIHLELVKFESLPGFGKSQVVETAGTVYQDDKNPVKVVLACFS